MSRAFLVAVVLFAWETVMETAYVTEPLAEPWSVKSRVSWSALIAGAMVGIAIYSLLAILGIAIGLTVADDASRDALSTGAAIWSFVSLLLAMFFAGWVSTVCTVGETRREAVLYGVIVWAVTSSLLLWLTAAGLSLGYSAVLNRSTMENQQRATEALEQDAGADDDRGDAPNQGRLQVDRETRERLQIASWWTFGGTILSMLASIGGALLGPFELISRRQYARSELITGQRIPD
jgi:hypothetical protein